MVLKPIVQWKSPIRRLLGWLLFWPFTVLLWVVFLVRAGFRSRKPLNIAPVVISVGSLSTGGSGKTPLVEFLAKALVTHNLRVGIVTTGYRKKMAGTVFLKNGHDIRYSVEEVGDETMSLALDLQDIPIAAGLDRVHAVTKLNDLYELDVVILDNGGQYHKIKKDIDIFVHDALEFQFPWISLPIGRMRDTRYSVSSDSLHIITRCDSATFVPLSLNIGRYFTSEYRPAVLEQWFDKGRKAIDFVRGKRLVVFSGLGLNESFQRQVDKVAKKCGAADVTFIEFNDHHWYRQSEMEAIYARIGNPAESLVLTTRKDAVKIKREWVPAEMQAISYFVLSNFVVHSSEEFTDEVLRKIAHGRSQREKDGAGCR